MRLVRFNALGGNGGPIWVNPEFIYAVVDKKGRALLFSSPDASEMWEVEGTAEEAVTRLRGDTPPAMWDDRSAYPREDV